MVSIYSAQGTTRYETPVNEGSKRIFKLMGDDYITLKFSSAEPIVFRLGDWCDIPSMGRFMVCEPYHPTFNKTTRGYDYELKMEAQHMIWRNKVMRYMPEYGGNETAWDLTATAAEHLLCVQKCVDALASVPQFHEDGSPIFEEVTIGGNTVTRIKTVANPLFRYNGVREWSISIDDTVEGSAKSLKYESTNIIDALTMIAEAYECEWWVEEHVIKLGRCEKRETKYIDFEMGVNVAEMGQTDSKSDFVTRLIPFGSERNISPRYRRDLIFTVDTIMEQGNEVCDSTRILQPSWFTQQPFPTEDKIKFTGVVPTYDSHNTGGAISWPYSSAGEKDITLFQASWNANEEEGRKPLADVRYTVDLSEFKPVVSVSEYRGSIQFVSAQLRISYTVQSISEGSVNKVVYAQALDENKISLMYAYQGEERSKEMKWRDVTIEETAEIIQLIVQVEFKAYFGSATNLNNPTNNSFHCHIDGYKKSDITVQWNKRQTELNPKVEGIAVQKIDTEGKQLALYENCIFNPYSISEEDMKAVQGDEDSANHRSWADLSKQRSMVRLPEGITMRKGDRYRIIGIHKADVKSSYFINKYAAFDNTSYISQHGIVTKRLMLPEDEKPYVQLDENLDDASVVEKVQIFEDVYPKALATITKVEEVIRYEEVPNDDGSSSKRPYTAYIVTDDIFSEEHPFKRKYILDNADLEAYFQDSRIYEEGDTDIPEGKKVGDRFDNTGGILNGFTFKMVYKDNDQKKGVFEIVRDDTAFVPNDVMKPKVGDQFVLCNYDISAIDEVLVYEAEEKLLQKAQEYLRKDNEDPSTYDCTLMPDYAREHGVFPIGTRINLLNDAYVESAMGTDPSDRLPNNSIPERLWGRKSRIIGYELNIDIPWDNPVYHVGEKPSYSKLGEISDKVAELKVTSDQMSALVDRYQRKNKASMKEAAEEVSANSEYAQRAGYADYATEAYMLDPESPTRLQFLSRVKPDDSFARITFHEGLTANGAVGLNKGFNVGAFMSGKSGAGMDERGNAEVESLKVRSYMEVAELIINRLAAIEGDQILTEADTIEWVEEDGENNEGRPMYILYFKKPYDGYFTAQYEGNILKGIVNTLANAVLNGGEADRETRPAEFYTSWMKVNEVYADTNSCSVTLYGDEDCPGGKNFPPCAMMKVARWGNVGESEQQKKRRSCLFLSSTEGRIVRLRDVTKPIIGVENYASTFGRCPEFLTTATDEDNNPLPVVAGEDYLYAKGIVVENIIKYDHAGMPEPTFVERGYWKPDKQYYCKEQNPGTEVFETSLVYHKGCKYQCIRSHTSEAAAEPGWGSINWEMIVGDPTFHVDFVEDEALFDPTNFDTTLTIKATLHNQDVTDKLRVSDVVWTREYIDHNGSPHVDEDNDWATQLTHANAGTQMHLTAADVPGLSNGFIPRHIKFTATVTLRDNLDNPVAQDTVSIGY